MGGVYLFIYFLDPILCEIENVDRIRKTAFLSGFFDQKKKLLYLKKSYIFFSDRKIQIEKRRFSFAICVFDLA